MIAKTTKALCCRNDKVSTQLLRVPIRSKVKLLVKS